MSRFCHSCASVSWKLVAGLILLAACTVVGQGQELPLYDIPPAPTPATSPYEPGLMLLAATMIFVVSGSILRLLVRMKVIGRAIWIVPILVVVTGVAWTSLQVWRPTDMDNLNALIGFMLCFLVFVSILYPIARLVLPSRALLTRGGVPPLLRGLAVALIAFVGMFILLTWSFPGLSLTPMFVTSGVVSIVMGLALQDLLSNLTAGIVMSVERPYQGGDWVRIGETEGEVVELAWRVTRVRTRENDYVLIPNNVISKVEVVNYHLPSPEHLVKIHVGVTYDTPPALAVKALTEAANNVEEVLRSPAAEAHFRDFSDSSLVYELRVWIDNYASLPAVESDVRKQIWYAFKRYGITIPFPQRDVNFRQVAEQETENRSRLVVSAGPLRGAMFQLGEKPMSIGRDLDSDLFVSDAHVSNQHAIIEPAEGGYRLQDLGSRHGTRLNGRLIESAELAQGDEINIGPVTLMYESNMAPLWTLSERRVKLREDEAKRQMEEASGEGDTVA